MRAAFCVGIGNGSGIFSDTHANYEALSAVPARRMVVGHTVQQGGTTSACGDKVWRIDVGLSHHYGGRPQVLEIRGDAVKAIPSAAP